MFNEDLQLPPGAKLVQQPPANTLPPGAKLVQGSIADSSDDRRFQLSGGLVADPAAIDKLPDARSVPLYNKDGVIKPNPDVQGPSGLEKLITAPLKYLSNGMTELGQGLQGITHPKSADQMAGSASDIVRGGMTTMTPFVLPELAAHPLASMLGLGTFGAAQGTTEWAAAKLGVPEGFQRLAGDIVGLYGGHKAYQWLEGLAQIPRMKEGDAIYSQLEAAIEKLKDPNLSPQARNALRGMTEGLLDGLKRSEGRQIIPPLFPNPNQAEANAYKYMREDVGVAPSAGAATGSPFVRGGSWLSGMTPFGAYMDVRAKGQTTGALRQRAGKLVADAMPDGPAEDLYADFRQSEAASRPQTVPLGVDKDGSIIEGDLKFPVDVRDLKYDLQPIYEDMGWMPAADRNSSAAYTAVKKILEGSDHITASQAELGLGQLKKAARENEGRFGGIAKYIVPKLQQAIDGSMAEHGGDDAVRSLQQGRIAAAKQAGADWLSEQFTKAQQAGGFDREKGLWHAWTNLKPAAKKTIFNAQQIAELDKFFLGVKMLAENPNPSGTALVGALMAQAGYAAHGGVFDPMFWVGQMSSATIAKVLRTDGAIKLLTDGLRIPRNTERGRFIEQKLKKILGENPPEQGPPAGGGNPNGNPTGGRPNPAKAAFEKAKEFGKKLLDDEEGSVKLPGGPDEFHKAEEGRRGERETADRSRVYGRERDVIGKAIARDLPGLDPKEASKLQQRAEEEIRGRKAQFSTTGDLPFQPFEAKDLEFKAGKPGKPPTFKVEYREIPYGFDAPVRGQKLWAVDSLTPQGEKASGKMADAIVSQVEAIRQQAKDALAKEPESRSSDDRTAMRIGEQRFWYTKMRTLLRRMYGSAGDLFADLLGASSAQTPVAENFKYGAEALERFTKGDYDAILPGYEAHRAAGNGQKSYTGPLALREGDKKFNANTLAVMDALIGMFRGKPGAPKTQNYSGNLIGATDAATIDVWAARLLQRIRHEVYGDAPAVPLPAEEGVAGGVINDPAGVRNTGQFMFGQRVFEKAAKQLDMQPHELQAFLWFVEKDLWTRKNLTSGIGEGGDMAAIARSTGLGRMLAGIEPADSSAAQNAVSMMREAQRVASQDPNVKSVVNSHALGMWSAPGGDNAGKPVFSAQFEVTLPENNDASINRVAAEIVKAAQKHNQDDAFIARTIPEESTSAVHARPGLSVYFKRPLSEADAWKVIEKVKTENIGGFTLFGGPKSKPGEYVGMRFVYMPEYVFEPAKIARMGDAEVRSLVHEHKVQSLSEMEDVLRKLEGNGSVGHAMVEWYDVLNANKEDYGRIIQQLERDAAGTETAVPEDAGGQGVWRRDISQSVKERAVARSGGSAGAQTGGEKAREAGGNGGKAPEGVNRAKQAFEARKKRRQ